MSAGQGGPRESPGNLHVPKENESLSHAGMNRIRSQGLLSAHPSVDTPSDLCRLYAVRVSGQAEGRVSEPNVNLDDRGYHEASESRRTEPPAGPVGAKNEGESKINSVVACRTETSRLESRLKAEEPAEAILHQKTRIRRAI